MAALSSSRNLFYSEFCRTKRDVIPSAPFKEDFHGRNIHQGWGIFSPGPDPPTCAWCLAYALRYQDSQELLAERGLSVDLGTINREVSR